MPKRKLDETIDSTKVAKQPNILPDDLLEPRTLKYDFMISLESMAVTKIVISLWMNENIQQEIVDLFYINFKLRRGDFYGKKPQVEKKVISQILELPFPDYIASKLIRVVPHVGQLIFDWVRYNDQNIFDTISRSGLISSGRGKQNIYSRYCAVDYVDYIAWTTRGQIDYAETAKNILSDHDSGLTDDHKYKLACDSCLENEITIFASKVMNRYYLDDIYIDKHPMVYFWSAYVTGDSTKLQNPTYYNHGRRPIDNLSTNGHIIQLLLPIDKYDNRIVNEVPVKYMWHKLSEEEKAEYIVPIVNCLGGQDFKYTLLSSLNNEQQQHVIKECCNSIFCSILDDWLWKDYFLPTAFFIMHIMKETSYVYILNLIVHKKNLNSQEERKSVYNDCKYIFKRLWKEGSERLKNFAIEGIDFFDNQNIDYLKNYLALSSLNWKRDMDIIEIICKDLNIQQKRKIILGYGGIGLCAHFIEKDEWDLLELFIKHALSSEDDIRQLKKTLTEDRGRQIADHLLEREDYDKTEYFVNWALTFDQERSRFKLNLAFTKICYDKLILIVKDNTDFTQLERHFKWCASDDLNTVSVFKTRVPEEYTLVLCQLHKDKKYELLDCILNWCFSGDRQQIGEMKRYIFECNL